MFGEYLKPIYVPVYRKQSDFLSVFARHDIIDDGMTGFDKVLTNLLTIETCFVFFFFFDRNYALRRVRDAFKEKKSLCKSDEVQKEYKFAQENLEVIRRQVRDIDII